MMKIRLALLLLLSIGVSGCNAYYGIIYAFPQTPPPPPVPMRGREPVDVEEMLGCWRMVRSGWPEPWIFALDAGPADTTHPGDVRPGDRAARAYRQTLRGDNIYWRITPRNTVEFSIDGGLHGVVYEFVPRDGRLIGRVDGWTDIVGVYSKPSRIVAERAPCPADA
ncbi:MAG TPA: hypothetical protein VEQ60_28100, partial [Longimicrobium sp.]|nr:hypothetical protein [Longimicrobium sp.]